MFRLLQWGLWFCFSLGMLLLFFPRFSVATVPGNATITIQRIGLNEPVFMNVNPVKRGEHEGVLRQGVAQAAGSALPGENGQGYYFAHSSSLYDGLVRPAKFARLDELAAGDTIEVQYGGETYKYVVTEKWITKPNDVSFLNQKNQSETIVLQTCWPIGTDLERLLIHATRAS